MPALRASPRACGIPAYFTFLIFLSPSQRRPKADHPVEASRSFEGQSCALQLASGTYSAEAFAPTQLNVADDPSRYAVINRPQGKSLLQLAPEEVSAKLAQVRVKRFLANWVRLALLLACLPTAEATCQRGQPHISFTDDILSLFSATVLEGFLPVDFFSCHLGFLDFFRSIARALFSLSCFWDFGILVHAFPLGSPRVLFARVLVAGSLEFTRSSFFG